MISVLEGIIGVIIFFAGLWLAYRENISYGYGPLPNLLCGVGAIMAYEGISKFCR